MANTAYATLFTDAQVYARQCPQPVMLNALRLSAIEFCKDSECYKYRPVAQDVTVAVPSYTFTLPTDTELHRYDDVKFNGNSIDPLNWDFVTTQDPAFPSVSGTPGNYTFQGNSASPPSTLFMVPVPDTTFTLGLIASLILRPTITSTGLDSFLLNRYKEAIVHGAIRRVSMMDKQVWSDMKKAELHGRLFRKGVADAMSEMTGMFGGVPARVLIRKFR